MRKPRFRLPDQAAVVLGLALLLAAGLYAAFFPQPDFSDHERRYLADAPSAPSLTRWETDGEIESYLSDRVPMRRALVALDASAHTLTGRRTQLEAWPIGGAFLEKPVQGDEATLERRLSQMEQLAQNAGADWRVMTPPTHGWLERQSMNPVLRALYDGESCFYTLLENHDHCVPLCETLCAAADPYCNTDHHWSLYGAYAAYEAYCHSAGFSPLALDDFQLKSFNGFYGTTYSRSGMPFACPDQLLCAQPHGPVTLSIADDGSQHTTLLFGDQVSTYDPYSVYLNGNHGLLEILNPSAPGGTLLVFKDSFANCLLPLLSPHYSRVVAVDARYFARDFSDALSQAGPVDELLFLYSLDSLLNDTVVARKLAR